MGWYLINILAVVLAWYWPTNHVLDADRNRVRARRTCITAAIGWILLSGLRGLSVGADTEAYAIMFEQSAYSPWSDIWQNVVLKYIYRIDVPGKDFGYFLLQKVFRTFTGSYTLWLLFIAIVFTVPMAILIYRYSSNACISWVVYSTLFYSFFAITGHRQTIATWGSRLGWVGMHPKEKADSFSAFDICRLHDPRVGDLCSAILLGIPAEGNQSKAVRVYGRHCCGLFSSKSAPCISAIHCGI